MEVPREGSARILIVDDHEDNVELLRARLESWGYHTESATDGEEALHKVEAQPPDLILLDVMMPKIDGIEVARRVKANENLPFIPIIMQTALDATENKVEGLEAGADIIKVFPGEVLGPAFIKAARGPLPQAPLLPTGGVSIDNVHEWIAAGAVAVGVGGHLTAGAQRGDFGAITTMARSFIERIREARAS